MAYKDSIRRFLNYTSVFENLFYSSMHKEVENGQYTPVKLLIPLFLCLAIYIFQIFLTWLRDISKHEVLLNVYLIYSGNNLCPSCKKKAGKKNRFIEEQLYTLKVLDFVRVQVFNDDKHVINNPQRIEHPDADACLYIHNCGGLESVKYEMLSEKPSHLICFPSLQYNCVFIEETESGSINKKTSLFGNCPGFVRTTLFNFGTFLGNFEHDLFSEKYYCSGSIHTTEKLDIRKMRVAASHMPKKQ